MTERAISHGSAMRVLHLEDNTGDAELIQATLESEGIACEITRVDTRADFVAALERRKFDIILADYSLPSFDGVSALKLVLQVCPDVPFIFVSGTLGEEFAVEALKLGATDYLLKQRLSRFGSSVDRALREAKERVERKRAEDAARDAMARFQGILELAQDAIISVDSRQRIILFNRGAEKLFGYTQAEAIGQPLDLFVPERFMEVHPQHIPREVSGRRKDGSEFPAEASISGLDVGSELLLTVILRDVTERKRAEEERLAHLWFLESMDRVNRAIQGASDLEQLMSNVLELMLAIFSCDRAWLVYPCDPEARSWKVPMEHTRPEFPGAFELGLELPIDPQVAEVFRAAQASSSPVQFLAGTEHRLPPEAAERFGIQSMIGMAIYPKGDKPYMLGLHQCSYARVWTPQEARLFQEIGRRLEDALTSVLMFRTLRESERKLEQAQRLAHVGHWELDFDTDLVTWSDETFRIFGLTPEERIFARARVSELIHPEDRRMFVESVEAAAWGGARHDAEYRVVRPSGEVRIVHTQGDVTRDASGRPHRSFGTMQDITERKRAEQRLVAQHEVTQILAEAATLEEATGRILRTVCEGLAWEVGAFWGIDREAGVLRCVQLWNKESAAAPRFAAASRETTFPPGIGLPGRVWSSRAPAYIPDVIHDENFSRAPMAVMEGLHAAVGFPILLGGEVLGVVDFLSHDIRQPDQDLLEMMATIGSQMGQFIERKRAEEALLRAQEELAHVTRVATLGELAASIAHEVNQPLAAIVNNATACVRWLAAQNLEEARSSAGLVVADALRAGDIVHRMRDLFKKVPSARQSLDANEVVRDAVSLARAELQRRRVTLHTSLLPDLPPITGDRVQLQQVIINLLVNALEAVSGSEGPREVWVTTGAEPGQVQIAVRDSGPGLDPNHIDRVFRAFYTTKPHGMGMGLAISHSIVQAHGGRLWATANEGRGAVFQFTVPTGGDRPSSE